jgi:hypothetical protein
MVAGGRGGRGGGIRTDPQMFTARNSSLKQLVAYAYHVWNYQISGGPSWLDSDPFDIEATTERPAKKEQFRLMLQPAGSCAPVASATVTVEPPSVNGQGVTLALAVEVAREASNSA